MNVKALEIRLGRRRAGILFQYALSHDQVINRFVADDHFARDPRQPVLSYSFLAGDPQAQAAFWAGVTAPQLNGALSDAPERGWLLPPFFQNLLPEGPLRTRIAELRGCGPNDHFELLAATGKDLPGDVHALPANLSRAELTRYIAQNNDALEMSVVAAPLEDGISVSGVQAKLAVLKQGDRFVARTKLANQRNVKRNVRHVIAKLPVPQYPLLPELEHLSLHLAAAAGVSVVESELAPLEHLAVEHGYDLGEVKANTQFLVVYRYDRDAGTSTGRVHCEDFAQVLGIEPEHKYTQDYLTVAGVLMATPSLGESAVHELLRRILVSDLMGNPDMHLKNIGLRYPDGRTAEFPPAYDLVGYAAYGILKQGRALRLVPRRPGDTAPAADPAAPLTPTVVRDFCARLGLPEKPAWAVLRQCAAKAFETWPALIARSTISEKMKARLVARLDTFRPDKRISAGGNKSGKA